MESSTLARLAAQIEQYLTATQAAARAGCSAATVYRAVANGDLSGVRIGTVTYLEPEQVDRWNGHRL